MANPLISAGTNSRTVYQDEDWSGRGFPLESIEGGEQMQQALLSKDSGYQSQKSPNQQTVVSFKPKNQQYVRTYVINGKDYVAFPDLSATINDSKIDQRMRYHLKTRVDESHYTVIKGKDNVQKIMDESRSGRVTFIDLETAEELIKQYSLPATLKEEEVMNQSDSTPDPNPAPAKEDEEGPDEDEEEAPVVIKQELPLQIDVGISEKYGDIFEEMDEFISKGEKIKEKIKNLYGEMDDAQRTIDLAVIDINHAFELAAETDEERKQLSDQLTAIMRERRKYKDTASLLSQLESNHFIEMIGRVKTVREQVKNRESSMENRKYTPRVMHNLQGMFDRRDAKAKSNS